METQSFASSAFVRTIVGHASECGLAANELMQRAGIHPAWLDSQRRQIPAQLVERLWLECERAGGGRQFGCDLVHGMTTSCLQGLNILLDSAATLRASLSCFVQFLPRVTNYVRCELEENSAEVCLHLHAAQTKPHFYGLDAATLALVRNIARRVGQSPAQVFSHIRLTARQSAGEELQGMGITVEWGEHVCLNMPLSVLELPLLSASAFLHQSMLRHWQADAPNDSRIDSLHMARHLLAAGDQPIERIAERVGYRQPNNFIRAFRKQFGITPKQYRLASL